MNVKIHPAFRFKGKPKIPGDKSISHRSLLFGALARGTTEVSGLLESGDVFSTWKCLEAMGVRIERQGAKVIVHGLGGFPGLQEPDEVLDCGNSGTTIRLLMGTLAGQNFSATLTGDDSLRRRPMKRVAEPLGRMGAQIELTQGQFAPIRIVGTGNLTAKEHVLPVASAQLKSALLLAGIFAEGKTVLRGLIRSRDHTERLLPHFGVSLESTGDFIAITGRQALRAAKVAVPGDISSAAFWIAAAVLIKGSDLVLENVLLNPTRIGFLNVLQRMGAQIDIEFASKDPEWVGTIRARPSKLSGTKIGPDEVPSLIDEIPMIAVLATFAEGVTEVHGAEELRVKESDRIEAVARNLRVMGAEIETREDGFSIRGPQKLHGTRIDSGSDHRIAMAFSIAGLACKSETEVCGTECVQISYPGFYETLRELTHASR